MTAKKVVKRAVEVKLSGKSYAIYLEHAGFQMASERLQTLEEVSIGDTIPQDYREFMLAYNGGKLLTLDEATDPKPPLLYFSNIKEVDDFDLVSSMLEGAQFERNSIALIGSNHDGSIKTFMSLKGKGRGEIYHFDFARDSPTSAFQNPSYKSFTDLLVALQNSEYAKHVAKSDVAKACSTKALTVSHGEDAEFEKSLHQLPINSKKFPTLPVVIRNLFDTMETAENEYGRVVLNNPPDKRKMILLMTYIRDQIHHKTDFDIQYYIDYYSPFRLYVISEKDLEELVKEDLLNVDDEITPKGIDETERLIQEEISKSAPRIDFIRPSALKGYVDVTLGGRATQLQLIQIGPPITEARLKKFEKDIGNTLPKDYREFLLGYNGGYARQRNVIINGGKATIGVKIYRDLQTLEELNNDSEWLAIGTDRNEHLTYMNLKDKKGYIYRYKYIDTDEEVPASGGATGFSDAPKQLLAKSFLEYVLNVIVEQPDKEEYIDEEYLDVILSDEIKTKFPQLSGVMYSIYDDAEKEIDKTGRVTVENKQDLQNIIVLVKFLTTSNSEPFSTVLNHTPFKFITITDAHIEELKKTKLLDKNARLSKKGRDEAERILVETQVKEFKDEEKPRKDKKKSKAPPPKTLDKRETLKRKIDEVVDVNQNRHVTRSTTKEKEGLLVGNKKR